MPPGATPTLWNADERFRQTYLSDPPDDLKGQLPIGFLVLKAGVERPHEGIVGEVVQLARDRIGAVAAFKTATVVARLPTRSGMILRATMRTIADGEQYTIPATIDDPAILGEIGEALQEIGYPRPTTGSNGCAMRGYREDPSGKEPYECCDQFGGPDRHRRLRTQSA
jgi:hypothetical protein